MANEITIQASLKYTKAGIDVVHRFNPTEGGDTLTQKSAKVRYVNRVQNITTTPAALGLGDVTVPGYCWMTNLGTTDIMIREDSGGADVVKVEAGEWACFRFAAGTPFAVADSGTPDLEYFILED